MQELTALEISKTHQEAEPRVGIRVGVDGAVVQVLHGRGLEVTRESAKLVQDIDAIAHDDALQIRLVVNLEDPV